ncbi:MAG: CinA family nicotinamide mononucleotide deamidase-related protein [Planctomycetia bacterium]|nr:CinA family nicotinamide mononucleotide deamidase-related protein [Planctomycetia bacterium]
MNHPEHLTAELISIGDEITSGAIVDTNSAWLSSELADLGIRTLYHSTVGDELGPMVDVFRIAAGRSDLILITGGIGPTEDDLTRQAAADLIGVPLQQDQETLNFIQELFRKRNRSMPESNRIQACFPKGAKIIPNPHGTAPGFECELNFAITGKSDPVRLLVFPGVPAEMKEMWNQTAREQVMNFIRTIRKEDHYVRNLRIHTFGLGESEVEARLPHLISREHTPTVGITAKEGIITLRIRAEGDDQEEVEAQIQETKKIIYDILGEYVFGEGEETLSSAVCKKLKAKGKKVGLLEWGTRGLMSSQIQEDCFCGSFILAKESPYFKSPQIFRTALEMFNDDAGKPDYLLLIGPYPKTNTPDDERDVSIAVQDVRSHRVIERSYRFGGHPAIIDNLYCLRAFRLLNQILE